MAAGAGAIAAPRPVRFRVRRQVARGAAFMFFVAALAVVLTLLGVIPVRAYVEQRHELDATRSRLAMLDARNKALETRAKVLQTDAEMQRLALDQFGMVRPGQSLTVIPGLRSEGSVLDSTRPDKVVAPVPAAKQATKVSRFRAILDAITFWKK